MWDAVCRQKSDLAMLATPTPPSLLAMCLPPDAERHLYFLLNEVKAGQEHRPKQWLQTRWLQGPSGEHTAVSMVRFLCVVSQSSADRHRHCVSRWSLLGWLLSIPKTMRSEAHEAAVVDWLHFNHKEDTLHSIEPGVNLLVHAQSPKHVHTATALLEKIVASVAEDKDRAGSTATALRILLQKKIVRSMQPILEAEAVPAGLRASFHTIIKPALPAAVNSVDQGNSLGNLHTETHTTNLTAALGKGPVERFTAAPDDAGAIEGLLKVCADRQETTAGAEGMQLVDDVVSLMGDLSSKPTASSAVLVPLLSVARAHSPSETSSTPLRSLVLGVLGKLQAS